MKSSLAAFCLCVLSAGVMAETQKPVESPKPRRSAGYVIREGSQKGVISFINTQSELDRQVIEAAAEVIRSDLRIKVVTKDEKPGDPASLVRASEGVLGIVVVADDDTPSLLVAPDDGWAVVNIRKLSAGLTTEAAKEKFLHRRAKRSLVRAFASVAGGLGSMYPGNLMSATSLNELDLAASDSLPEDTKVAIERFLKSRGYAPAMRVPYRKACQQGWAPAPTNDVQRAIWNQVHAIPDKPMTIEFDPKKDK